MRRLGYVVLACAITGCGDEPQELAGGFGGSGDSGGGGQTESGPSVGPGGSTENHAPIASAGQDLTAAPGDKILLNGTGSSDPDGDELSFEWQIDDLPAIGPGAFEITSSTLLADLIPGTHTIELTVRDAEGLTAVDSATLHINTKPKVVAGADREGAAGATVSLAASASDPDGDVITFNWTQVAGPPVALSDLKSATASLVLPPDLHEPLVYQVTASDSEGESEPDWITVVALFGPDSDADLLEDSAELALGTDPADADSDDDGIPDGWEVGSHEFVDYAALGCSPLHRDVLLEIDYQPAVQPSELLIEAWRSYYAGLAIDNPDGTQGLALHPVLDSVLDDDFYCGDQFVLGDRAPNPLYREAFHTLSLCQNDFYGGVSELQGKYSSCRAPAPNSDPADDLQEEAVFTLYALTLHELGHALGLHHGGDEAVNYKPNYPSYMNYEFSFELIDAPRSIAETDIALSRGVLPNIDECALVESAAFAGVAAEDSAFLQTYDSTGWLVEDDGSIDWDHDGTIELVPYELVLRSSTAAPGRDFSACRLVTDNDDLTLMAARMAGALDSDPVTGPMLLSLKTREVVP